MEKQIEIFNDILRDKYNVYITLSDEGEFLYRMMDINRMIGCDYCADKIDNITIKIKGYRYYKIDNLIQALSYNRNGVRDVELLRLHKVFRYNIENEVNLGAINYIKKKNIDLSKIAVVIIDGKIRFKLTNVVEDSNKRISYAIYLKSNLKVIKPRKEYYIDIYGIRNIDFIESYNLDAIIHLSKYNKYFYHEVFRDDIFFKIRRHICDGVIYYNVKDFSSAIKSFTNGAEFCKRYIFSVDKADFGGGLYISQENIYEGISMANTFLSIELCNKYKIKNDFLRFGGLIQRKIKINKKDFNYAECENGEYLFRLKDIKIIDNYRENLNTNDEEKYFIYVDNRINEYIRKEDFVNILKDKIKNVTTTNSSGVVEFIYKIAEYFDIDINNENKVFINKTYFQYSKILSLSNHSNYINNKFNLRLGNLKNKKDMYFLEVNNKLFVLIGNDEEKLLHTAKNKFGKEKYRLCVIKNSNTFKVEKVLEFDIFECYLSRMKNNEAIEMRKCLGIPEKYIPILEYSTIPIFESAFPNIKFKKQYKIKNKKTMYSIDLAIPKHKIGIECDELDHRTYNKEKEVIRNQFLESLGWIIIRYNPTCPQEIGEAIRKLIDLI